MALVLFWLLVQQSDPNETLLFQTQTTTQKTGYIAFSLNRFIENDLKGAFAGWSSLCYPQKIKWQIS